MAQKFKTYKDLPMVSEKGYKITTVPLKTWNLISDIYNILKKTTPTDESEYLNEQVDMQKKHDIQDGLARLLCNNNNELDFGVKKKTSELFSIAEHMRIRSIIMSELYALHADFAKPYQIKPTTIYGIRSYKKGSILYNHRDRVKTHHISSIIVVDKKCDEDWPLDFRNNDGEWEQIYLKPGDLFIYESARCEHGRKEFKGDFFRNLFISYHFADYEYVE